MNMLIIGVVWTLLFFIALATAFYFGYRLGQRKRKEKLSEEELRLIKQMEEGFRNVMTYDYSTALERRGR